MLATATMRSANGQRCQVRPGGPVLVRSGGRTIVTTKSKHGIVTFPTKAGREYEFVRER